MSQLLWALPPRSTENAAIRLAPNRQRLSQLRFLQDLRVARAHARRRDVLSRLEAVALQRRYLHN
jgi:hypothetical protein